MVTPALTEEDRAALAGERGAGTALAMRIVVALAEATGAPRLIDVTRAHIDGCLYHGRATLDFVERLVDGGARVRIPTTLNVGSLDLLHPDLYRGDAATGALARRTMDRYVELGCSPTWTCAPYQLPDRPALGEHVAWAESNAIVFANAVLGARTARYGDFIDAAAAVTGRVPETGLHTDAGRRATVVVRVDGVAPDRLRDPLVCAVIGTALGDLVGSRIPAIVGLPGDTGEDALKALAAAAASSGSVALFHAVGVTPEAPTLDAVAAGASLPEIVLEPSALRAARARLTTAAGDALAAVSVGTPHFSPSEFEDLVALLPERPLAVPFYVSTGRDVLQRVEAAGWLPRLAAAGVTVVTDTCTYVTPILREPVQGAVMTNSAKWAWYAPGNLGVDVVFGSLAECVGSAVAGRVVLDGDRWLDA
jgi:predicted aconitase